MDSYCQDELERPLVVLKCFIDFQYNFYCHTRELCGISEMLSPILYMTVEVTFMNYDCSRYSASSPNTHPVKVMRLTSYLLSPVDKYC